MIQMKVATHVLNGRRVGQFVDLVTLGSRETLKEVLEYGYVTGKEPSLAAVAKGVSTAKIAAKLMAPAVPRVEVTAVNGQSGADDVFIFLDGYCRVKGHNLMLLDGDQQLTFVVTSCGGVAASEPQVVEHDVAFGG